MQWIFWMQLPTSTAVSSQSHCRLRFKKFGRIIIPMSTRGCIARDTIYTPCSFDMSPLPQFSSLCPLHPTLLFYPSTLSPWCYHYPSTASLQSHSRRDREHCKLLRLGVPGEAPAESEFHELQTSKWNHLMASWVAHCKADRCQNSISPTT